MTECERILERLYSKDPEILREYAFAAGEGQCLQSVERLAELLCSENAGVQEAAELTLRKLGGTETVQALIPLLESEEANVRNAAMDVLRDVGHQDLDRLVDLLQATDQDLRIFAADILGYTGSVMAVRPLCEALLKDAAPNVRYQAAVSLGLLGHQEASRCLTQALQDQEWIQFAVVDALKNLKDESCLQSLINTLGQGSDLVDFVLVEALGEMGHVKAVPLLLSRMDQAALPLRNKIVQALVKLLGSRTLFLLDKQQQEKFLQYLLAAVQDEDQQIQDTAVLGLKHIGGERASRVIFELCLRMDPDQDPDRLEWITAILQEIGYTHVLDSALHSRDELMAGRAAGILTGIKDPRAVQSLMDVFWNKDRDLQREISLGLSRMAGEEAKEFFREVLRRHQDGKVLKNAIYFLGHRLQDEESAAELLKFLEHRFNDVKETALEACASLNSPLVGARFKEFLQSSESIYRVMALYGLSQSRNRAYLEDVQEALQDQEPEVRKMALEAVAVLGNYQPEVLPKLVGALDDPQPEVRLTLIKILGLIQTHEVEDYLLSALQDTDDWVKIRALEALVDRGFRADIQSIIALLQSPSQMLKIKTIEALGQIGGEEAFQALLPLLQQKDVEIQTAVEKALGRISQDQNSH
ncbi:MAG: HEAT repeat domain-containing protein [Desulfohalobiaceae bacterium]